MTTTDLATGAVLTALSRSRAASLAAEVETFQSALEWCRLHEVTETWQAATWQETGLTLGGEGTPLVAEFCIAEFGAAMGTSTDSARTYLAHALEIGHRLPRIYARVIAGELPVWRARRIAEQTLTLSPEAAGHVDRNIARYAHKSGPSVTDRLVAEAVLRFMPGVAEQLAKRSAEHRHVTIAHDTIAGTGVSSIYGLLDTADAIDLDTAITDGAAVIKAAGCEDTLDVRRAMALGDLARGHHALPLDVGPVETPAPRRRDLTLYLHLNAPEDIGDIANIVNLANLENAGGHLITPDTLTRWCNTGDARVVIKPVIDLNTPLATSSYVATDKIREHVILRDRTCVFPHCTRPARACDLDHINEFDPNGPPDQTNTSNLACLCRRHHRLKTFSAWTYTMTSPGIYLWRSPHGYRYLRDKHGTTNLTPTPIDPPDE